MIKSYKLSKREKILIFIVAVFLCIYLSVTYLFLPAINKREEVTTALSDATITQIQVRNQVAVANALMNEVEKSENESEEKSGKFLVFTQTENIESEFTTYLTALKIKPMKIMISYNEVFNETGSILIGFTVEITAEGKRDDLLRFPDYLNDRYSYRLTGMRISDNKLVAHAEYVVEAVFRVIR